MFNSTLFHVSHLVDFFIAIWPGSRWTVACGSMCFEWVSLNSNVPNRVLTLSKVSVSSSSNFFRNLLEWHELTTWSWIISFLFVNSHDTANFDSRTI